MSIVNLKELTIEEKLRRLYRLQQIDSEIDNIQVLKGELPMEVRDLEDELAGLETRISNYKTSLDALDKEIVNFELGITESKNAIEKYNKQLDSVKNVREHDALVKEIDLQKLDIQLYEKKIRDARQNKITRQSSLTSAEEKFGKQKSELDSKKEELAKIIEKTEKEEKELQEKSDYAQQQIEDRLLKAYIKVRKSYRNGLAVARIERDSCGGCFNKIPPQTQLEIGQRKKIIACEHCGRVLVDELIAREN